MRQPPGRQDTGEQGKRSVVIKDMMGCFANFHDHCGYIFGWDFLFFIASYGPRGLSGPRLVNRIVSHLHSGRMERN